MGHNAQTKSGWRIIHHWSFWLQMMLFSYCVVFTLLYVSMSYLLVWSFPCVSVEPVNLLWTKCDCRPWGNAQETSVTHTGVSQQRKLASSVSVTSGWRRIWSQLCQRCQTFWGYFAWTRPTAGLIYSCVWAKWTSTIHYFQSQKLSQKSHIILFSQSISARHINWSITPGPLNFEAY